MIVYRIIKISFFLLGVFAAVVYPQDKDFSFYYKKGMESYTEKNYQGTINYFKKALEFSPNNPGVKYNLACSYALNHNKHEAVKLLNELINIGFGYDAEFDKDFDFIRNTKEFNKVLKNIQAAKTPIGESKTAFIINEKDLVPESIAYDSISKKFYLGSLYKRKIIEINKDGEIKNFTTVGQDGLWSVLGIKVDSGRRILWANSATEIQMKDFHDSIAGLSGVFKFDLNTGKLIKKYILNNKPEQHLLNDLVITSSGDVYITDSKSNEIYLIDNKEDEIKSFYKLKNTIYPNGITISPNEKLIFAAHFNGITVINLQNKTSYELQYIKDIYPGMIDGLYFHNKSLIAVQNSRIVKFQLNKKYSKLEHVQIIESGNPFFDLPTTGVLVNKNFYYIANSQLRSFESPGKILPAEKLNDIRILKTKL